MKKEQSTNYPPVSVIVLTCNGRPSLERNLPSVLEIEYPKFEVLVIDNGSTDGTTEYLHDVIKPLFKINEIPVKLIRNEQNVGISEGRNVGIRNSKGKYITFLDNDARAEKTWLRRAISLMEADNSIGIIQCKILLADGKHIDTVGIDQYCTGLARRKGYGEQDDRRYDNTKEPIFADGPGLVFRREVFEKIGLFDPWLFTADNGDFSWRMWMTGYWRITFVPDSIIYHEGSGTLKRNPLHTSVYFANQDKIYLMLKNYDSSGLLLYFPTALLLLLVANVVSRKRGECLLGYTKALLSIPRNMRKILVERKKVQKLRKVSSRQLIKNGIIKKPDPMMFKR